LNGHGFEGGGRWGTSSTTYASSAATGVPSGCRGAKGGRSGPDRGGGPRETDTRHWGGGWVLFKHRTIVSWRRASKKKEASAQGQFRGNERRGKTEAKLCGVSERADAAARRP